VPHVSQETLVPGLRVGLPSVTAVATTVKGNRTMTSTMVHDRIRKLSTASERRVVDPDRDLPGNVGDGQLLPDELLSTAGLGVELTPEQRRTLSREEIASITEAGIRFEAVLEAGFALQIVQTPDLVDPRTTYLLHEIGEETRHQRIFLRMLEELAPTARNPFVNRLTRALERRGVNRIITMPALLYVLVLGGEEIPDLFQKLAGEHPDTDPFVREVNRYHRQEEARHLSFARAMLPEIWERAGFAERFAVRHVAPWVIGMMFDQIVHPGVYETVGLPAMETWKKVRVSDRRRMLKAQATRPVLDAVVAAGVFKANRVPKAWRRLVAGESLDDGGSPVDEASAVAVA